MSGKPRRIGEYEDVDWQEAAAHLGECAMGSVGELRSNDPPGRPFERKKHELGFCTDPNAYKRPRKRRKGG